MRSWLARCSRVCPCWPAAKRDGAADGSALAPWDERMTAAGARRVPGSSMAARPRRWGSKAGRRASIGGRAATRASCISRGPSASARSAIKCRPTGSSLNGAPPSPAVAAQLEDAARVRRCRSRICASGFWASRIPTHLSSSLATRRIARSASLPGGLEHRLRPVHAAERRRVAGALVLSRADARVRIAVDHWEASR